MGISFSKVLSFVADWNSDGFDFESPIAAVSESGHFKTDDGAEIYYEDTGESGETLFFVYGLGCSISHWKYQMEYFQQKALVAKAKSKKYRIVWMDYRGHGKSRSTSDGLVTLSRFVDDIYQLCEHLRISKAIFLGQSMGGTVALNLASTYPKLVKKLILQGSPPVAPSKTINAGLIGPYVWKKMIFLNKLSPKAIRIMYKGLPKLARPIMETVRFVGFNPKLVNVEDVKEYTSALLAANPNVFWSLADDMEDFDVGKFEKKVMSPTLIIAGAKDNCVPLDQINYLAAELPNSQLELIPHGSHCPHLDDPHLVNKIIENFLEPEAKSKPKSKSG